ncbi:MAG: hypothetical protein GY856_25640 [bacterium]|nr:hypothetical protein [bacterium]
MPELCAQHPQVAAIYRCAGCSRHLCEQCIEESHALLLCRLCGEQALPLAGDHPATTKALRKERALTAPYSFREALLYPFRGTGLYLYLAALAFLTVLWFLRFLIVFGLFIMIFNAVFWLLVVGLQFRIVRSTAEGDNELPDWPDFTQIGGLLLDLLTWTGIHLMLLGLLTVYFMVGLALEPNYLFSLGLAVCLWLGTALAVMAYGAAGNFTRLKVLSFHNHVRGFLAAGSDAVVATNMVFGVGAVTLVLRLILELTIPLLGGALSCAIEIYWLFTLPHLSGLVFRRHSETMERFYWTGTG